MSILQLSFTWRRWTRTSLLPAKHRCHQIIIFQEGLCVRPFISRCTMYNVLRCTGTMYIVHCRYNVGNSKRIIKDYCWILNMSCKNPDPIRLWCQDWRCVRSTRCSEFYLTKSCISHHVHAWCHTCHVINKFIPHIIISSARISHNFQHYNKHQQWWWNC